MGKKEKKVSIFGVIMFTGLCILFVGFLTVYYGAMSPAPEKKSPKPIYFSSGSRLLFFEFGTELVEKKVSYYLVKAGWNEIDVYQFHDKIKDTGREKVVFLSQEDDNIVIEIKNKFINEFNVAEWEGDETDKLMEFLKEKFGGIK